MWKVDPYARTAASSSAAGRPLRPRAEARAAARARLPEQRRRALVAGCDLERAPAQALAQERRDEIVGVLRRVAALRHLVAEERAGLHAAGAGSARSLQAHLITARAPAQGGRRGKLRIRDRVTTIPADAAAGGRAGACAPGTRPGAGVCGRPRCGRRARRRRVRAPLGGSAARRRRAAVELDGDRRADDAPLRRRAHGPRRRPRRPAGRRPGQRPGSRDVPSLRRDRAASRDAHDDRRRRHDGVPLPRLLPPRRLPAEGDRAASRSPSRPCRCCCGRPTAAPAARRCRCPPVEVATRLTPADVLRPELDVGDEPLPAVTYRAEPDRPRSSSPPPPGARARRHRPARARGAPGRRSSRASGGAGRPRGSSARSGSSAGRSATGDERDRRLALDALASALDQRDDTLATATRNAAWAPGGPAAPRPPAARGRGRADGGGRSVRWIPLAEAETYGAALRRTRLLRLGLAAALAVAAAAAFAAAWALRPAKPSLLPAGTTRRDRPRRLVQHRGAHAQADRAHARDRGARHATATASSSSPIRRTRRCRPGRPSAELRRYERLFRPLFEVETDPGRTGSCRSGTPPRGRRSPGAAGGDRFPASPWRGRLQRRARGSRPGCASRGGSSSATASATAPCSSSATSTTTSPTFRA